MIKMNNSATLDNVYKELKFIRQNMVSKEEFNSMLETFEVIHNPQTMKQIQESEKDIK
ncbi:hypothetical protein HY837_05435, partial [archaeon]|nr:hypothetical protein [archaeon]